MQHVIHRTDQGGGYLAKPGSKHSYTKSLAIARKFDSFEAAEAECCPENETPLPLEALLDQLRY